MHAASTFWMKPCQIEDKVGPFYALFNPLGVIPCPLFFFFLSFFFILPKIPKMLLKMSIKFRHHSYIQNRLTMHDKDKVDHFSDFSYES